MTKNEQKRQRKRKWKKLKNELTRAFHRQTSHIPLPAVAIGALTAAALIILLAQHPFSTSDKQTRQNMVTTEVDEALEISSSPTPKPVTPTPENQISLSGGELQSQLRTMLSAAEGDWSIYVKNLDSNESFSINNQSMYAASLIKLYVMKECFLNLNDLVQDIDGQEADSHAYEYVMDMLEDMITVSDNDAYNNLVSLLSDSDSFLAGARLINADIQEWGYTDTTISHSLIPAEMDYVTTGGSNLTSVEDCGKLLEEIYRGTCVSASASEEMLALLMDQETTYKIPEVIPASVKVANKTGETDESEHDAAIVYGPTTDYILCVMSYDDTETGDSIGMIQQISEIVYEYLNP